ncbi:hypothetical protein [Endozoicomonas elysicola]|uniref:Uncharacterized protein n=1 Tax=Endozoicomonas elysicola TaxID=305900 RepID=A0A081KBZ6_9GAMM|nr:hypothetical protein [Endozoicomonas elysicola]KEI71672.1 hypothetical protein GV64_13830 [Endozoicomonas elysicola]
MGISISEAPLHVGLLFNLRAGDVDSVEDWIKLGAPTPAEAQQLLNQLVFDAISRRDFTDADRWAKCGGKVLWTL